MPDKQGRGQHASAVPPAVTTEDPPPRLDEYPSGTVVAVMDDLGEARAAAASLADASAGAPYVLAADEVLAQDRSRRDEQGPAERLYVAFASLLSDQGDLQGRYVDEARAGHHMVVAQARDDAHADEIWAVLRRHGAHDGSHVSGTVIRELLEKPGPPSPGA